MAPNTARQIGLQPGKSLASVKKLVSLFETALNKNVFPKYLIQLESKTAEMPTPGTLSIAKAALQRNLLSGLGVSFRRWRGARPVGRET